MALNWSFIQNVTINGLTDDQDDAQIETLFDQLTQYDLNGTESVEQLQQLFRCSKLVMQSKGDQVDVVIEELENQKNLKSNLYRNNSADKQNEQRLLELESANEQLRIQVKEKNNELNRLEQAKSNLEETLKQNEKQLSNYSQEIEQLREELHLEKQQINEQLADNNLPFEQLRDMNKKFYMLLEEMKDMETTNTQLGEKVMKLNEELDSATYQIQAATKEMLYMKNSLHNLQEMNDILINEKEEHMNELRRLKKLTDNYELESDEHIDSSSKKIQDLTDKLRSKEEEFNELKKTVLQSMDKKQMEEKKSYYLKEISKRDNHIKLLRNQLSQAIDDIEAQTQVIENLIDKNIEQIHRTDSSETGKSDLNGRALNRDQLIGKLEEELRSKDKEMTILNQRNKLYEQGIFGLSEAVEEINKLSKLIKSKDNEIDNLVKELNAINLKLSNTQDELDYLKEIMSADDDLKKKLNEDSSVKNDKLKILKLQKEVIRLDAEKLQLYEELLSYKLGTDLDSARKLDHTDTGLSSDNLAASRSTETENVQDIKQLQKLNAIQELENENRELQLAMKEILIGLKESDSKSDVIIDCPSLERLCQFFESRSINSNLANVIALKAELDILRGHNEELRMSNKRLRNDIFKIFENYSKHLLNDFVHKHHHPEPVSNDVVKDEKTEMESEQKTDFINQTLTEDELYDSDLSEGEIVLNSRSIAPNRSGQRKDQEIQTEQPTNHENEEENGPSAMNGDDTTSGSSDEDANKKSSLVIAEQADPTHIDETRKVDSPSDKIFGQTNKKLLIDQTIQTDLCLTDLRNIEHLKRIDEIEEFLKLHSLDDLKKLIEQRESIEKALASQTEGIRSDSTIQIRPKKDATVQTIEPVLVEPQEENRCTQCSLVQNLLIEFQNKIDRIDSGIVQREDLYSEQIRVLQDENNRLQTELQRIVQIKDDLLNQKEKQIIELNDRIVNQKERLGILEEEMNRMVERVNSEQDKKPVKSQDETEQSKLEADKKKESASIDSQVQQDPIVLDKQGIDSQLVIINKTSIDSANQRGLISILETITKCLQTRIEHKDEAIVHYQQLLTKTQEEHQQEIQKLMKNYKKVTEHSMKAIQSSSNVNQEQLESTLVKYNDQLNEFKCYHQKVLVEQKKTLELQNCKMKKLKTENERLKSQANFTEELNRLRIENDQLNKMVEKNVKFIDKLKNAIKAERAYKQQESRIESRLETESTKTMQLNKLKEESENLYKLLISKDKQIKELQLNKWNLEKKISEIVQSNKTELKAKTDELEKLINDQIKLKALLDRMEKEKSALKRKQLVIRETSASSRANKETQTDRTVNFDLSDNSALFMDKFRQLDQTIVTLKLQLQNCAQREKELITILEQKGFGNEEAVVERKKKKELSIKSIKGRTFEISKKNSCDF